MHTCDQVLEHLREQLDDLGVAQGGKGHRGPCEQKITRQDGDLSCALTCAEMCMCWRYAAPCSQRRR